MTFTYDSAAAASTATILHNVRLEIGDTDSTAALFTDEEIGQYTSARGLGAGTAVSSRAAAELLVCADLYDALAGRFARAFDFQTDGQTFKRSQMVDAYLKRAQTLRARASGITTQVVTRVDGYSDDIAADETQSGGTANPRQSFYVVGGLDRVP